MYYYYALFCISIMYYNTSVMYYYVLVLRIIMY